MNRIHRFLGLAAALACAFIAQAAPKPNILFIVGDDMGYADVGFHGGKDIPTPHLDALAASGARFTSGYVTGPYCSPTRAALLTGRYQNRFGHEYNPRGAQGMPTNQITIADRLRAAGYRTALVGKWHLGSSGPMRPLQRGFDEFFGFLGGANSYFNTSGYLRGDEPVKDLDYSTDAFGREACAFIERHRDRPWFLYLAFNAVHTPMDATTNRLARFAHIEDPTRRAHNAMLLALDEAIGAVLKKLAATGQRTNTLVAFISDNGGPTMRGTTVNGARNAPLRGSKRTTLEGGVRVPFLVSWPGRVPPAVFAQPVIQLDLTATALAAAGVTVESSARLDGVDLLPLLAGDTSRAPHDALYWRFGQQMAIRSGDWKLVRYDVNADTLTGAPNQGVTAPRLYNLAGDIGEANDLAAAQPDKVNELQARWDEWNRSNAKPLWGAGSGSAGAPAPNPGARAENNRATPSDRLDTNKDGKLSADEFKANGAADRKPNIVFFLADDLGQRDIGCYGSTFHETPNLDQLAKDGAKFTAAYAACPVCSPTRASILTGQWPQRTGITDYIGAPMQPEKWQRNTKLLPAPYTDRLALAAPTLAKTLKSAGYATFFAGKWHLGPEGWWPENQGFDINMGGIDRGGPYGGKQYFSPYGNPRLSDGPEGEHLPDRLATETAAFIETNKDRPFFAYYAFYDVHTPLMAREDLRKKYAEKRKRLGLVEKWGREGERDVRLTQDHAVYAAMVEAMDLAVGKVLAKLDELGLRDNTLVIFTSDNGGLSTSEGWPTSNHPLRGGKGWMYEGGIREPLLVRWPAAVKPGTIITTPVSSPDFFPTLLDAVGTNTEPGQVLDGISLVPVLQGAASPERALFWHYPHYGNQGGAPAAAVRRGDWKLIEWAEDNRAELFNLAQDPGEQTNLAEKEPQRLEQLRAELAIWQKEVGAKFPSTNPRYDPAQPSGRTAKRIAAK